MSGVASQFTQVQKVRVLYKTILKLHRGLPPDLKLLGNEYARNEFKRHRSCNPTEALIFMREWTNYALTLAKQLGLKGPMFAKPLGAVFSEDDLAKFREDQLYQLYELMLAATGSDDDKKESQKK